MRVKFCPRFRFVASKESDDGSNYLRYGDVIEYNNVVQQYSYFDQQTGIYTVPFSGNYVLVVDAYKYADSQLKILVNEHEYRDIHDTFKNYAPFNGMFLVYLNQNDEVKLRNFAADSIFVTSHVPITFMGYFVD